MEFQYAAEIKEIGIKVTLDNYPNTIEIGDVNKISYSNGILHTQNGNYKTHIDLVIFGSPCQTFSISMKEELRVGLANKEKSGLFIECHRILREVNPTYFFMENVGSMKNSDRDFISSLMGVEPLRINSALVSAQLRDRYYWTNIPGASIPEDKGITFQSILEDGWTDRDKARCLLVSESRPLMSNTKRFHRYTTCGFINLIFDDEESFNRIKSYHEENYKGREAKEVPAHSEAPYDHIRILSQVEMERLQTVPEGYTRCLSRNEAADVLGDGWTIDVIAHIFNNTSLDCADTYIMAKSYPNCEIMNPDKGFYQYVETDHMIPTRFARFCCRIFKVGVMVSQLDKEHKYLHFMGMRNEESSTRSGYEDEWINETEWGKTNWQGILSIRKWTELDIWLYTLLYEKNIEINPKYKKGYARCGCHIACPYYTKSTWILDKYWYKNEYERWRNIIRKDFIDNKKWLIMNCTIDEYITQAWNGGTFRSKPTSEVIAEFANYNNIDVDVAARYFTKYCIDCEKRIKDKETLSMNMKLHGRNTNIFMCKKHLSIEYGMDSDKWNEIIEQFKQSGCELF